MVSERQETGFMAEQDRPAVRSIADLARIAGVSVSTVSRALTGKGTLNPDTRLRVQALADAHGFRLNVAAQNLRLGRTGSIAVLLPLGHARTQHLSDPFFATMLAHLGDRLAERGYDLLLSRVEPGNADWVEDFVRSGRSDGIIVIGQSDQDAALGRASALYRPMVVWGAYASGNGYTTVGTDNRAGGELAARHLAGRGRSRLAFFGEIALPEFAARHAGFRDSLPADLRAGLSHVPCPLSPEESHRTAMAWFGAGNRADGVFAVSDVVALSVLAAAREHGIDVPGELSVVGFDDIPMACVAQPALTTVRQDIAEGARTLVDLLMRRIAGEETGSVQFVPTLVVRRSS